MPTITMEKRSRVETLMERGFSQRGIARTLSVSLCAVQNILKKLREGRGIQNKPKSGRPILLSARTVRSLIIESKKFPFKTAGELLIDCGLTYIISIDTVKRILRRSDLYGRVSIRKPLLSDTHKKRRLLWCRTRNDWTLQAWQRIIFTDECKLDVYPRARKYVRRPRGAALKQKYLSFTKKFSPSIIVWGAIRGDGKKVLVRCIGNINADEYQRVLQIGLPQIYTTRYIFQQDGATCHTARSTSLYLTNVAVRRLPLWPSQSPDLNLIENLWDTLKTNVRRRNPTNVEDLWRVSCEEWDSISNETVTNLYMSMPRRIQSVIAAKGGNTKY